MVNRIESPFAVSFRRAALLALALVAGVCGPAAALELITEAEAALPAASAAPSRGGITRGPSIKVVSPGADAQVKAPFAIKIDFQPHGGSKIDASSVKVIYLKKPTVDLTPRIKSGISETGISVADAVVPAGKHDLRIEVTDAEGRTKSEVLSFTAAR